MINKILTYFPNSVTQDFKPTSNFSDYHWFKETEADSLWVGIPKKDIDESQVELLKVLYDYAEIGHASLLSGKADAWHQFLFKNGEVPSAENDEARVIQFRILDSDTNNQELAEALQGFLPDHILVWHEDRYGVLIEEKNGIAQSEEELESIISTIESDFFTKIAVYAGKFQPIDHHLQVFFVNESKLFSMAINREQRTKVYTFENLSPMLLSYSLPEPMKNILGKTILEALQEDRELLLTIKVFLENNANASLAAKKLYIHRNTLQYRIEKFTEKTRINLKDFDSAVMAYIACLHAEKR